MMLKRILCFSLIALTGVLGASSAGADVIRLTSGGAPKEAPFGRFLNKLLTEAFDRLGYGFELHNVQAKRASHLVNLGYFDGEAMRVREYGERYPLLTRVNVSHSDLVFSAYATEVGYNIVSWRELNQYQSIVAYRRGAVRPQNMLKLHLPARNLRDVSHPHDGLKMLLNKSADIYVGVQASVETVLKKYPELKTKVRKVGEMDRVPGYVYLNKKHEQLAKKLEVVLLDMKNSGLIAQYYHDVYGIDDRP